MSENVHPETSIELSEQKRASSRLRAGADEASAVSAFDSQSSDILVDESLVDDRTLP